MGLKRSKTTDTSHRKMMTMMITYFVRNDFIGYN